MYFIIFYLSFVPAGVQLEGEIYRWLLRDLQLEGEILAHNLKIENVHPSIKSLSSYLNRTLGCTVCHLEKFRHLSETFLFCPVTAGQCVIQKVFNPLLERFRI